MRYFTLLLLFAFSQTQGFAQDDFSNYRTKYNFERERFTGTNTGELQKIVLPFDTTIQKQDFTAYLNKTLDFIPKRDKIKIPFKRNFEGWRIQIYRGKNREDALRARNKSYEMFPNLTPYMVYRAPTYRVHVGDFLDPSEYQSIFKKLKRVFPLAIVTQDIITIIVDTRDDDEPKEEKK